MSRLSPPSPERYTQRQREVHDEIASGPRGGVHGPLGLWLWRPELAAKAQTLGRYCRYDTLLPARLSELAILVTARHWSSEFEWQHHKPIAMEAGLDKQIIEAIRMKQTPKFTQIDERVVFQFCTELLSQKRVSDDTYHTALDQLGRDALVDLVGLLGYYALISMTINTFEVPAPSTNELDDCV